MKSLEAACCTPALVGKRPICPATADEDDSGSILLQEIKFKVRSFAHEPPCLIWELVCPWCELMHKEKGLNSLPIVPPYGEVNVTMLPCHPSDEKIDSPPAGEPVRYTRSFEQVVSLLEMCELSFRNVGHVCCTLALSSAQMDIIFASTRSHQVRAFCRSISACSPSW